MMFTPVRLLTVLVVMAAAALVSLWVDAQGHWQNLAWQAPAAKSPDVSSPSSLAQLASASGASSTYASILERPIFAPDRRPPPPPAPPPPPDPMANIQITGIFSGANAGILARVDGKVQRIKLGESVGSWALKSVVGREATFSQGAENRVLNLVYAPLGVRPPPNEQSTAPSAQLQIGSVSGVAQNQQDEARERLRRTNAIRAANGIPVLTQ